MIRVILLGRTGNHLFQYALGRVLAEKHDTSLVMDASWFNSEGWAEVSHFLKLPIRAHIRRRGSVPSRALRKLTGKHYWEYRGLPVLRESSVDQSFDACFLNAPANCVLLGYFQSPRYFQEIATPLRSELNRILSQAVDARATMKDHLQAPGAVAVHVRRTDYLRLPLFQVCDEVYYRKAMDAMRERNAQAKFFIFSDDPEWCRQTFQAPDTEVVTASGGAANPLHDLYLMSLASHHIIANSTYSWWAAWLGRKPGQQVFMPDRWFAHGITAPIEEKRLEHWTVVR